MATADCTARREREDRTIARALRILEQRAKYSAKNGQYLLSPDQARNYLRLRLEGLEREEFWAVWLDTSCKVIEVECLFAGTLNQTAVYPREVVRRALHHNAASVLLAHNHPSGNPEPSDNDVELTGMLRNSLSLIDVRVLDHIIIAAPAWPTSLVERGLM